MTADQPDADPPDDAAAPCADSAYAAFDAGDLAVARAGFESLIAQAPDQASLHYMHGLASKYLRDWAPSLRHNLRALALYDDGDDDAEAARWNAGIAATALGDWAEARRQWAACGIDLPSGRGAIDANFGVASVRLAPWREGETVFARRIDPVRARIIAVPLPDSGFRYGDIVLHDGAATGERRFHQSRVPVFNAMQRLETSPFATFALFVRCPRREDIEALVEARVPGIGFIEDWTDSIVHLCLRCSYGAPHGGDAHAHEDAPRDWRPERNLGVAAQSRHSVLRLVERWKAGGPGRRLDAIERRDAAPSDPPPSGLVWWRSPDGDGEADGDARSDP